MKRLAIAGVAAVLALSLTACHQQTPDEKYADCMKAWQDSGQTNDTTLSDEDVCWLAAYGH